jgi:DNA-binding NarL/FixJ family response regulator
MVAYIVSPSVLVAAALESSVRAYFKDVLRCSDLDGIKSPIAEVEVILYDLTSPQAEVEALLRFDSDHDGLLRKVAIMTRQDTDLVDLVPLVGNVGTILPSASSAEDIAMAARVVQTGLTILPFDILGLWKMASDHTSTSSDMARFALTGREKEVARLLTHGQSNKMIARNLSINDTTVRVYVRSILQKLEVQNRTQAALLLSRYYTTGNRSR